MHQLQGIARLR